MRGSVTAVVLAVVGLLLAASVGFAAYYASRDSVGLPVTKLEPTPRHLAPTARALALASVDSVMQDYISACEG